MKKWIPKILAIIFMIPIVIFGIGLAIVWNVYLLTNSLIRDIKRNQKNGRIKR